MLFFKSRTAKIGTFSGPAKLFFIPVKLYKNAALNAGAKVHTLLAFPNFLVKIFYLFFNAQRKALGRCVLGCESFFCVSGRVRDRSGNPRRD